MIKVKTLLGFCVKTAIICAFIGAAALGGAYLYLKPGLPEVDQLRDVRLQTPLRIYSRDHKLIAEFGEMRRTPISYEQIPEQFVQAILSAEDSRFQEHIGIDFKGLARAAFQLATSGRIQTGGSTITMQVAKNYFLTRERTFIRKFNEILLALQIEQELSKEEILELYVNKIYLGNRAYGIQAAANVYYGRDIDQLTLAELAMIAGLPKAPSAYNPLANPSRALERRNWILSRMRGLNYISDAAFTAALQAPITAKYHGSDIELGAPYVAEMVRAELQQSYGDRIYTDGFSAYTTINSGEQDAANRAVVDGLLTYDRRHGYRGPERRFDRIDDPDLLIDAMRGTTKYANLEPAVVLAVDELGAELLHISGQSIRVDWEQMKWAWPYIDANNQGPKPERPADILQPGDQVRVVELQDGSWQLNQIPEVQGALVALDPQDGAIRALVGGFSFAQSKFNRVAQGTRQPGSNFKPFVYTAALERGFTPASVINDAPVVFEDSNLESNWRPENYSRKFYGPTRLREALYTSRNLVSIRILRQLGVRPTLEYVKRFGFAPERLPNNLSLALGTADVTPLELATGYAAFANQGYKITPYLVSRVIGPDDDILFEAQPATVCPDCIYMEADTPLPAENTEGPLTSLPLAEQIIDQRSVYLINNIMQDVIKRGTGAKAKKLGRTDLAGKTGTTNDQKDAWFSGFNQALVASVWVGFDQPQTLGRREYGSTAALPIWIDFMSEALADVPETPLIPPQGIVSVRIDPKTGLLAYPGQADAIFEFFRQEDVPTDMAQMAGPAATTDSITPEELF
ncbi:penicillin-binding protein 1A [Motiliproteus sediminis]|uniref:penicillin-binding protein 1A n=1 Tax=Motiliproteus sediminis TaxID=1468178 RepID=UPI001AEFABE1|nr:penicillin-binding protein 1A [Motiliproteus sediminis]